MMCFISISIEKCLYRHTVNTAGTIDRVSLLSEKKTRFDQKLIIDFKSKCGDLIKVYLNLFY